MGEPAGIGAYHGNARSFELLQLGCENFRVGLIFPFEMGDSNALASSVAGQSAAMCRRRTIGVFPTVSRIVSTMDGGVFEVISGLGEGECDKMPTRYGFARPGVKRGFGAVRSRWEPT